MAGTTSSIEEVLAEFPTKIIHKIGRETKREALIELYLLISGNAASVASNLGGSWHGHLTLTTIMDYYTSKTGYAFVPPHNPRNYPPTMGTAQEQALRTERF